MTPNPESAATAPMIPPINAWLELDGIPKYQVNKFQKMEAISAATSTQILMEPGNTISSPIVFATATPNRKGPENSATAVIYKALRGDMARENMIVATMLLES